MKRTFTKVMSVFLIAVMLICAAPLEGFAKNDQHSEPTQDSIQVQSSNALGNEISELMTEQQEKQSAEYVISRIDVVEKTATVEMYNKLACTVVVAIFEENGKMVGSGKTEVEAETALATVEIDVMTMPEYFVAKAYLLDENMASLCDEFVSEHNTKNFQEFLDLTVEDFEGMIVVSLEPDSVDDGEIVLNSNEIHEEEPQDNNFFVAKEGTQQIYTDGTSNILVSMDDETGIYVFENADQSIKGLNAGETFFYDCGNADFILAVVDTVVTENNITTITAADAEIYDLFECIKLENEAEATQDDVVEGSLGEGVTFKESDQELVPNGGFDSEIMKINTLLKITYDNDKGLKAGATLDISLSLSAASYFYYSIKLFGKDKIDFWFKLRMWHEVDLSAFAEYSFSHDFELYCVEFPVYAGIDVKTDMSLNLKFSGEIHSFVGKERVIGFSYNSDSGFNEIKENRDWSEPSATAEGSVEFSFEMGVGVVFVKVLHLTLNFSAGIGLTAAAALNNLPGDMPRHHDCAVCFSISADLIFGASFDFKIGFKFLKATLVDVDIAKISVPIASWYYSISQDGTKKHGFGECKNWSSRVWFYVVDIDGNPVCDVLVDGEKTDEKGNCSKLYLDGEHTVEVSKDGYLTTTASFTIDEKPIDVAVMITPVMMTGISVKTLPTKTSYYTGDKLDTSGLVLTAKYNDGKTETITTGYTCTPTALNTAGTQAVTVNYNGFTTKFNVSVTQTKATNISVATKPIKLSYFVGDTLDTSGLVLTENYNNGDIKTITSGYTCTPTVLETAGTQTVTVKYGSNTCTYTVDVTPVVATGVAVSTLPTKLSYFVGDTLDTSGLVLTETYNNGKTVAVTDGYTCTPTVLETAGTQTVTVTYGEHSCTFDVVVTPVVATEIIVSKTPDKVTYYTGDTLDLSGLELTVSYNNGDVKTIASGYICEPTVLEEAGKQTITVIYGEKSCTFDVTVILLKLLSCEVTALPNKTNYFVGDILDMTGLVITETYNNGEIVNVSDNFTADIKSFSVSGEQIVTVIHGDYIFTFNVMVYNISDCSGTCGENLVWIFDPDSGLLEIEGTGAMTDWSAKSEVPWYGNANNILKVNISDGVTTIGDFAFADCINFVEFYVPKNIESVCGNSFNGCINLVKIIADKDSSFLTNDGEGVLFNKDQTILIKYPVGKSETSYIVPETVEVIGDSAFCECVNLISVSMNDNIVSIEKNAFKDCIGLENVVVPDSVVTLKTGAFSGCAGMVQLTMPALSIKMKSFDGCVNIKKVTVTKGTGSISCSGLLGNDTPWYISGCDTIVIEAGVNKIGANVFKNCDKLIDVYYTGDLIDWCAIDFSLLSNPMKYAKNLYINGEILEELIIPAEVTEIKNYTFYGMNRITKLVIHENVTSIGSYAFEKCTNITEITLPVSAKINYSFDGCTNIQKVTLTKGTGIMQNYSYSTDTSSDETFYEYTPWYVGKSKNIIIEDGVTNIGDNAFFNCDEIENISLPEGVTKVGDNAFMNCKNLKTITIPESLISFGYQAFYGCSNLKNVYYTGTEEQWANISIASYNTPLTSATIHYNYSGVPVTQSVNNEVSTFIAMPILNSVMNNSYVVSAQTAGAVVGNRYTLIALDQTAAEYDLANLAFIDHTLATGSDVSFSFMPKSAENLIVLIIGDFGSGIEQRVISGAPGVAVTDVRLSNGSLNLYPGQDPVQLTAYITPDNASIKDIIWTSSNTSVAAVDKNGVVTPYNPGEATITAISASDGITAECKVTVTARVFEISWIMPDGTHTVEYDEGESIAEYKNTDRTGYTFIGWDKTVPNRMPADNLEFTALYKPNSYAAKFNTNGGKWADGTAAEKSVNVDFDSDIPVQPEPTKQGYIFSGWEFNGENLGTNVGKMISVSGMTFTAAWVPAKDTRYTVNTYTMNENGEYILSEKVLTGTTSETVTLSPEIENGFELNEVKSVLSGKIEADNSLVLSVYIDRKTYTFTTVVDGKGRSVNYMYGEAVSEPETPTKQGYTFAGWDASVPQTMPAENIRLNAQWNVNSYTVTWNSNGDETVDTLYYGAEIVKPKNPAREGYTFADWTPAVPATVPAENLTFYATWYVNTYDVTWTVDGKTTTESYKYGEEIAKPADPAKTGYTFIGWGADIPENMPAGNLEFTAQWQINTYSVTWNVDGYKTVDTLIYGAEIVKPNNPTKEGYTFIGWSPEIPATVPAKNLTFTAQYELLAKQLKIKNPSTGTVKYGETLVMHADFGGVELPEGWSIKWTVDGTGFSTKVEENGMKFKVTSIANGTPTIKATLVDENGEAALDADGNEMSDSKQLKSDASFWQKIVSFFKNLFRVNRIIAG